MTLTITELNELVYCLGRVITEDSNGWNMVVKKNLYNKIYTELETRTLGIEASMREQGFLTIDEFVEQLDAENKI